MSNPDHPRDPDPPTWGPAGGQPPPDQTGQPGPPPWGPPPGPPPWGQPDPQSGPQQGYPGPPQGYPPPAGYPGPPAVPPYYGPPGYPGVDPQAPYGRHPLTGEPYSDKQKIVAGLLQLFLGGVGAGRWYLGDNGIALAQLLTCGGLGIWALIDGIQILMGDVRDPQGRPLRD